METLIVCKHRVDFTCNNGAVHRRCRLWTRNVRLRPPQQSGKHLGPVAFHIIVDRCLPQRTRFGCSSSKKQHLSGTSRRSEARFIVAHHLAATIRLRVRAHCKRRAAAFPAPVFPTPMETTTTSFDWPASFHADCLFDGKFRQTGSSTFYVGRSNTRAVRFDAYFSLVVDHALYRYSYLHERSLSSVDDQSHYGPDHGNSRRCNEASNAKTSQKKKKKNKVI